MRASRGQQAKVADDTRLSPSTRKHLIQELKMLEEAFDDGAASNTKRGKKKSSQC